MIEHWNNRPLTPREQRLRDDHRCVGCGVKVQGTRRAGKPTIYPYECRQCAASRLRSPGDDLRANRQSTGISANPKIIYRRILGYSASEEE